MKLLFIGLLSIMFTACQMESESKTKNVNQSSAKSDVNSNAQIFAQLPESAWKLPLVLPELPYAYNALEPYIDAQTMEIHHTKHHNGYTINANKALESEGVLDISLVSVFANIEKYNSALRNNGGGYYNHNLFWTFLTPDGSEFEGEIADAITQEFESFDEFKKQFNAAAASRFGSGWAWLVLQTDGSLAITSTANQNNPLMQGEAVQGIPLLNIDVWEHAYYLAYQNKRADYISNFWNVVNWQVVNARYVLGKRLLNQ